MLHIRIFLFCFFSLNVFSYVPVAKTPAPSRKAILQLTAEAAKNLRQSKYDKSLSTARVALQYAIDRNDDYLIAKSYNTIAANYEELAEVDKAIFYYKKGLFHADKTDNDTIKNSLNNNLGNTYCFGLNNMDKGLSYYKRSLNYSYKISDTSGVYITKVNITWAYFHKDKFNEGKPYLDFINKHQNEYHGNGTFLAVSMLNGMFFTHKLEFDKAESFFLKAIKSGKEAGDKSDLPYVYEEYAKLLKKKGDFKKAYENLVLYNSVKKELEDADKFNRANVVGVNIELDEYKRKVDAIESEKNLQAISLQKSRIIVALFVIALTVVLLLLYSVYKNYKFKKEKNEELTIANNELLAAKEKAEEASYLKSQFVSTISHELRTPLYGVVGITNMILDEHKELADSPHLSALKFSARYLLSLVNDVLQINKIEENRIILESLTFNLADEINLIKNSLLFIAKNHNNQINVFIDPAIPEYLIGDKLRFSQIIINLINNALKFTNNGEVNIKADLVKIENKAHYIEFNIQDNGIGIAEEDQGKIFDKFVQIGRKEIDYQGTGLGLSIVKRLLELFGSTISLKSKIEEGTTFTFTIAFDHDPIRTVELINKIQVDLTASEIFNVLVVDDNKINQLITKKIILNNNYKCTVVESGMAALAIVEMEKFDVILMDINMPLMNGFETTKRLRQNGIKTPVIALTAFDKEEITEEALASGMNDIIIKPFEPVILFKTINQLLYKSNEVAVV
ncbi:response regulator [Flavobacterium hiemivividum]|uniref:histidine kinase n=1 Tax=Flavobacterium hiemivividum TaxID=2541734 RepID=A0A4V2Z150_9FLAO|nr:response regulator [Flavobacterium hiemivividum]TDE03498.1 response regulator [Flavobacterium hiemivividum]